MPPQNVEVPHREFVERADRHAQVLRGLDEIDLRLRKLLAELLMLRLFDELQEAIAGVALRLACGTPYADGTLPNLLTSPARSTSQARRLYESFGRTKPTSPKWSKTSFINRTTKHVLDPSEPFTSVLNANALVISDMRAVRNRIAHGNATTRKEFAEVVRRHYGAKLNHVSPGFLLLSPRIAPSLLEQYVAHAV